MNSNSYEPELEKLTSKLSRTRTRMNSKLVKSEPAGLCSPRAGNLKLALDQHLVLQIADLDPRKQLGAESIRELRGRPFVRRAFALGSHRLALRSGQRNKPRT